MTRHPDDDVVIPLADLPAQYTSIKGEIDQAVLRVLASGQFALGPEVAAFEEEFASYCGTQHAIAVNSGTSALHLALLAAGVGPGDEVITVPFTFISPPSRRFGIRALRRSSSTSIRRRPPWMSIRSPTS